MNSYLLNRSLGSIPPSTLSRAQTTRLIYAVQPAPGIRFASNNVRINASDGPPGSDSGSHVERVWAHQAGVNALVIDRFEGRFMISGGADASIYVWDLESAESNTKDRLYRPAGSVKKTPQTHTHGLTALSFYPFDSDAFLSSSYDHSLKIYSSTTLDPIASFDLTSVVYSHALSPIASHLLVACTTQHPAVRLVDLRSSASTHSLAGHSGAVLAASWSPKREHVLASAGTDGTVRVWDIRRSAGQLGQLDMEDSRGLFPAASSSSTPSSSLPPHHRRQNSKAHLGPANGVLWTPDGNYIVSTGHDEKIRVWDASSGANTLTSFGPVVRNRHLATCAPVIAPPGGFPGMPGKDMLFFPSEREILCFELFEGRLVKRLRTVGVGASASVAAASAATSAPTVAGAAPSPTLITPGPATPTLAARNPPSLSSTAAASPPPPQLTRHMNVRPRVTGLALRGAGHTSLYSSHSDGLIRAWAPRTTEDAILEDGPGSDSDSDGDGDGDPFDDGDGDGGGGDGESGIGAQQAAREGAAAGSGGGSRRLRKRRQLLQDVYEDFMTGQGLGQGENDSNSSDRKKRKKVSFI